MKTIYLFLLLFVFVPSLRAQKSDSLLQVQNEIKALQYHQNGLIQTFDALKKELDVVKADHKSQQTLMDSQIKVLASGQKKVAEETTANTTEILATTEKLSETRTLSLVLIVFLVVSILGLSVIFSRLMRRMILSLEQRNQVLDQLIHDEASRLGERVDKISSETRTDILKLREEIRVAESVTSLLKAEHESFKDATDLRFGELKDKLKLRIKKVEKDIEKAESKFEKSDEKSMEKLKSTRKQLEEAQLQIKNEIAQSLELLKNEWHLKFEEQQAALEKLAKPAPKKKKVEPAKKVPLKARKNG